MKISLSLLLLLLLLNLLLLSLLLRCCRSVSGARSLSFVHLCPLPFVSSPPKSNSFTAESCALSSPSASVCPPSSLQGARAAGAEIAGGSVVVFLDSHIEALDHWLEPLLQRLKESPKTAALPRVASIDAETFEILNGGIDTLAFSWNLGHWHRDDEIKARPENKKKEEGEPIESPIMPGGIFAIRKDWSAQMSRPISCSLPVSGCLWLCPQLYVCDIHMSLSLW